MTEYKYLNLSDTYESNLSQDKKEIRTNYIKLTEKEYQKIILRSAKDYKRNYVYDIDTQIV